jgi:hypothetical protein
MKSVLASREIVVTVEDDQLMVDYKQGRLGNIPLFPRSDTKFLVTVGCLRTAAPFRVLHGLDRERVLSRLARKRETKSKRPVCGFLTT